MLKQLINLANELDQKGLKKEADYLDALIRKLGESVEPASAVHVKSVNQRVSTQGLDEEASDTFTSASETYEPVTGKRISIHGDSNRIDVGPNCASQYVAATGPYKSEQETICCPSKKDVEKYLNLVAQEDPLKVASVVRKDSESGNWCSGWSKAKYKEIKQ